MATENATKWRILSAISPLQFARVLGWSKFPVLIIIRRQIVYSCNILLHEERNIIEY